MKKLLDVEKTRIAHYSNNKQDSVHRSSLLVPVLPNSEVSISLLNHFLIKRNISSIGCRVTAIGKTGQRLVSQLTIIDEPRVYTMHLQRDFNVEATSFLVEFFSSENIFIPFPAVMVNHRTKDAVSGVHSFNRVLADVFEDDDVNAIHVQEAAIDIVRNPHLSTFFVLTAGPYDLKGPVRLRLNTCEENLEHVIDVDIPRFTNQMYELEQVAPSWSKLTGTLFIDQPEQKLFYGRLFVGQVSKDGSFVGNHSYYYSSHVEGEFWNDGKPSFRTYPVIDKLDVLIRFYPIMSPSTVAVLVIFNSSEGNQLGVSPQRESLFHLAMIALKWIFVEWHLRLELTLNLSLHSLFKQPQLLVSHRPALIIKLSTGSQQLRVQLTSHYKITMCFIQNRRYEHTGGSSSILPSLRHG